VAHRAAGYDIPGTTVAGSDVLACYAAARETVARARAPKEPPIAPGAALRAESDRFERPSCPLCGATRGKILLEGDPKQLPREHGKANLEELFIAVAREPLALEAR